MESTVLITGLEQDGFYSSWEGRWKTNYGIYKFSCDQEL